MTSSTTTIPTISAVNPGTLDCKYFEGIDGAIDKVKIGTETDINVNKQYEVESKLALNLRIQHAEKGALWVQTALSEEEFKKV